MAGRTVLITGAGNGIGAALAGRMAASGASVAVLDIDGAAAHAVADGLGARVDAWQVDITDASAMAHVVDDVISRYGAIDVVVANAAIESFGAVEAMEDAEFDRVVAVDLVGVQRTVRATLPALIASRGYVLHVVSLSGVTPGPLNAAYNASKAGVIAFAKTLRLEVAGRGVDVGICYLSYIDTPTARAAVESELMAPIMARVPAAMRRPIPVATAVEAMAGAIDRRAGRIVVPRSATVTVLLPELAGRLAASRLRL
jgi:NAD(P)-dependent dehydrogenase (short-subunit alcohol dehydrogenase family)